jgi:2-aminoadipate transaminase
MCAALSHHLGDVAHWTDPEGGFFIWVTFDDPRVDAEELFRAGLDAGVAFIPGSAFSPTGRFGNSMRLCFASQSLADIEEGVARLGAAYRNLCAEES